MMIDEDLRNLVRTLEVMDDDTEISIGRFRCAASELRQVAQEAWAARAMRAAWNGDKK